MGGASGNAARERMMLDEHGTEAFVLLPGSIIGAAEQDLRLRDLKAGKQASANEPYAFHRFHVARASSAIDLIRIALSDLDQGLASGKRNTRLIYRQTNTMRKIVAEAM